MRVGKDD
jgi:hypothetical protein